MVAAISLVNSLFGEGAAAVAIMAKAGVAITLIPGLKDLGSIVGEYRLMTRWNMTSPTMTVWTSRGRAGTLAPSQPEQCGIQGTAASNLPASRNPPPAIGHTGQGPDQVRHGWWAQGPPSTTAIWPQPQGTGQHPAANWPGPQRHQRPPPALGPPRKAVIPMTVEAQ